MTSSKLNYFPTPNTVRLGARASTHEFGETHSVPNTHLPNGTDFLRRNGTIGDFTRILWEGRGGGSHEDIDDALCFTDIVSPKPTTIPLSITVPFGKIRKLMFSRVEKVTCAWSQRCSRSAGETLKALFATVHRTLQRTFPLWARGILLRLGYKCGGRGVYVRGWRPGGQERCGVAPRFPVSLPQSLIFGPEALDGNEAGVVSQLILLELPPGGKEHSTGAMPGERPVPAPFVIGLEAPGRGVCPE